MKHWYNQTYFFKLVDTLTFDQELIRSDIKVEFKDNMTMKKTSQLRKKHVKNSGPNHFKIVVGDPFKTENETTVFKNGPYYKMI